MNISEDWSLSGGGLHRGESVVHGAEREVKEELGITLNSVRYLGAMSHRRGLTKITYELVVGEATTTDFVRDELEIVKAKWFDLDSLPDNRHQAVDQAINMLNFKS